MRIQFDFSTFDADATKEMRKVFKSKFKKFVDDITPKIYENVELAIQDTSTYKSLVSGKLRAEFGLGSNLGGIEGKDAADSVIQAVVKNIKITEEYDTDVCAALTYFVLRTDLSDALSSEYASYISNTKGNANNIEWLKWLLFEDTKIVVGNASIIYEGFNPIKSRTRQAIMTSNKKTGAWSVPSEFAGTQHNNWLTKALNSVDIETIIKEGINKIV